MVARKQSIPAWHGVGHDPPWNLTGAEFDRRTRRYFHGTTTANAKRLLVEQRPDPSMYGTRTDYGFFGEGFYVTTQPSSSYGKNVLVVDVSLDASVLEWSRYVADKTGYTPASEPPWFRDLIDRQAAIIEARGRVVRRDAFDTITPGHRNFSIIEFVRAAYSYAKAMKYDVFQPTPFETVILEPSCVTSITRAGKSFADAVAKYSHRAIVEDALGSGLPVPREVLAEYGLRRSESNGRARLRRR